VFLYVLINSWLTEVLRMTVGEYQTERSERVFGSGYRDDPYVLFLEEVKDWITKRASIIDCNQEAREMLKGRVRAAEPFQMAKFASSSCMFFGGFELGTHLGPRLLSLRILSRLISNPCLPPTHLVPLRPLSTYVLNVYCVRRCRSAIWSMCWPRRICSTPSLHTSILCSR